MSLRAVILGLFLAVLGEHFGAAAAQEFSVEEAEQSLVRILAPQGDGKTSSGTGFIVSEDGYILTNTHVIAGGQSISVFAVSEEKMFDARLIDASVDQDIALLKIDLEGLQRSTLSVADRVRGSDVFALGYPGAADRYGAEIIGQPPTLSKGIFSAEKVAPWDPRRPGVTVQMLQHGAAVTEGNSGGPLYDSCGRVIGINTQRANREGVYFASAIEESMALLRRHDVGFIEVDRICAVGSVPSADLLDEISDVAERPTVLIAGLAGLLLLCLIAFGFRRRSSATATAGPEHSSGRQPSSNSPRNARRSSGTKQRSLRQMGTSVMAGGSSRAGAKLTGFDRSGRALKLKLPHGDLNSPYGVVIGRDDAVSDVPLVDAEVSRRHVRIFKVGNSLFAEDLGSTNGTCLESDRLKPFEPVRVDYGGSLDLAGIILRLGRG